MSNLPNSAHQASAIREALHSQQSAKVFVISGSMRPFLRAGDEIVIVGTPPHKLRPGDIITFELDGTFTTHRLQEIRPSHWQTRGDHTGTGDPPIDPNAYIGQVIARVRNGRILSLQQDCGHTINQRLSRLALKRHTRRSPFLSIKRRMIDTQMWTIEFVFTHLCRAKQ